MKWIDNVAALEIKLFKMSLILLFFATSILMLYDFIIGSSLKIILIECTAMFSTGFIFFLTKSKNLFPYLVITIILLIMGLVDYVWYSIKTMTIGYSLYFMILLMITQIVLNGRLKQALALIIVTNVTTLLIIEGRISSAFTFIVYDKEQATIAKAVVISVTYFTTWWLVTYLKNEYDRLINLNKRQNEILEEKNKEIQKQHEKIVNMNISLKKQVIERTQNIEKQKEQLLDFAFFNSHRIRRPLSNALALLEILNLPNLTEVEKEEISHHLSDQINKLDIEVWAIQEKIYAIPHIKDYNEFLLNQYKSMENS